MSLRPFVRLSAAAAVALLTPNLARPCSVCAAGDPLVAASDAASEAGVVRLALEGEWLTAEAASASDPSAREELTQTTLRLHAVVAASARVNVAASLPLVRKELHHGGAAGEHLARTALGDAELGVRWFVADATDYDRMRHQSVALSAGSSLPTGEADAEQGGARLDDHAQSGTGAWGPYAGILYRLEQSRWHAFASLSARWRSENRWGHRYGAALLWSLQAQWQARPRLALGLGLDGRSAGADRQDGRPVPHTGGLLLAAVPGLFAGITDDLWFTLRAQLPVASALRGDQRVGPVVTAGLALTLR